MILEEIKDDVFAEKLILIDRIQSVTEKYLLVSASHGRMFYWEYEGNLESIKQLLD